MPPRCFPSRQRNLGARIKFDINLIQRHIFIGAVPTAQGGQGQHIATISQALTIDASEIRLGRCRWNRLNDGNGAIDIATHIKAGRATRYTFPLGDDRASLDLQGSIAGLLQKGNQPFQGG